VRLADEFVITYDTAVATVVVRAVQQHVDVGTTAKSFRSAVSG